MSILVDEKTRLLVQGITGREGGFHARMMLDYGTSVVAGVTPGKGGQLACDGRVPVYDSVAEAQHDTGANATIIYVPARFAVDAILEAAYARIPLIVCITEGIPVLDLIPVREFVRRQGSRLIGPNCPGLLSPGKAKVGILPGHIASQGSVGVVSRSGTLTYEVVHALTQTGIGQSTCVGIGGDALIGTTFVDVLRLFEEDPQTDLVVLIGEIGGHAEEEAARFIGCSMAKPAVAFVAGRTAPKGKRMGHAGAIIEGDTGSAEAKIAALRAAGATIVDLPRDIASTVSGLI
jgi:succinyl-CoA synthetase alpha subunit